MSERAPTYRPQKAPLTCTYSVRGRVRRQSPRPRPRHLPPHHRPRGRRKSAKNDPLRHFPLFYCANFSLFRAPSGPHRPEIAVTSKNTRESLLTLSRFSNVNEFYLLTLRFPTWENSQNTLTVLFIFDTWLTLADSTRKTPAAGLATGVLLSSCETAGSAVVAAAFALLMRHIESLLSRLHVAVS